MTDAQKDSAFSENAQRYWARGLSVLPTEPGTKQPAKSIKGWPGYLAAPPTVETRSAWLELYSASGLALLLGGEVLPGLVLVGIDVDDDLLVPLAQAMLGGGVVGKRGKKGATLFALVPKLPKMKSTTFKGAAGLGNIDILAGGKISVMEPSIHPETGWPYKAVGRALIDTPFDEIPHIDQTALKLLKLVVGAEQTPVLLSGEETHTAGLELTAKLIAAGATDDSVMSIVRALLPSGYDGNSLDELPRWISSARERGFDKAKEGGKSESLAAVLVDIALQANIKLLHDADGTAFVSIPNERGSLTYRVSSHAFKMWMRHQAHSVLAKPISIGPLHEAIATLESIAMFEGDQHEVHNRVAGDLTSIEIDLGRSDGVVMAISPAGWEPRPPKNEYFVRGAGFRPLPNAEAGSSLGALKELLHLDDRTFHLIVAFMINALKPVGPYLILLVEGEQGSGKSFACQVIKELIDPNSAPKLRLPDNDRDLMIHAKEYWLLNYDNASGMKVEMSDALCSLATGGGVAVRRLYTDGELNVMSYARPFIINGISGYASRPDLLERAIPIRLPPLPEANRLTEDELLRKLADIKPGLLGALYACVAMAIKNFPEITPPRHLRMADAARWIAAAEPAVGVPDGTLIKAITEAQRAQVIDRANEDPLVIRLRQVLSLTGGEFNGYVAELYAELAAESDKSLPGSPSRFSAILERLRPAMVAAGFVVEFSRDNRGRKIRLKTDRVPISGKGRKSPDSGGGVAGPVL